MEKITQILQAYELENMESTELFDILEKMHITLTPTGIHGLSKYIENEIEKYNKENDKKLELQLEDFETHTMIRIFKDDYSILNRIIINHIR